MQSQLHPQARPLAEDRRRREDVQEEPPALADAVQQQQDQFDAIYTEVSLPLLITVLYFMYQLPVVRKMFLSTLPMCYGKSGDINLTGRLINSLLFGAVIYGSSKLVQQLSR